MLKWLQRNLKNLECIKIGGGESSRITLLNLDTNYSLPVESEAVTFEVSVSTVFDIRIFQTRRISSS